jgi:hypothetical protein
MLAWGGRSIWKGSFDEIVPPSRNGATECAGVAAGCLSTLDHVDGFFSSNHKRLFGLRTIVPFLRQTSGTLGEPADLLAY